MIKALKTVKKLSKIIAWLSIVIKIFIAIKNILDGNNPGPEKLKDDHKS